MKLPALDELLQYENPAVLKLYIQNHSANKLTAEDAFRETLKYLWLSQKHKYDKRTQPDNPVLPGRCIMLQSMREIDEMWHEFILFTKDYSDFCQHYFGEYMHHLPNIFDTMPLSLEEQDREVELLLPYIYDHLGEATMNIWFAEYLTAA